MWLKTGCIRAVSESAISLSLSLSPGSLYVALAVRELIMQGRLERRDNVTKMWQVTLAPQKVTDLNGEEEVTQGEL